MIMQSLQAAQNAPCIRVRYTGEFQHAAFLLNVSTPTEPFVQLGVSNTDLTAAAAAAETVITGDGSLTLRDVVAAINNWFSNTEGREVLEKNFEAVIWNGLYTDVFGAATSPYSASAGTVRELKNTWHGELLIVDDSDNVGYTSLRLPPPQQGNGAAVVLNISGLTGTSGTSTVTRSIYDLDGNVLWSTGEVADATDALMNPNRPTFVEPVMFSSKPIVIRDTVAAAAENIGTTMQATWALMQAKNL